MLGVKIRIVKLKKIFTLDFIPFISTFHIFILHLFKKFDEQGADEGGGDEDIEEKIDDDDEENENETIVDEDEEEQGNEKDSKAQADEEGDCFGYSKF